VLVKGPLKPSIMAILMGSPVAGWAKAGAALSAPNKAVAPATTHTRKRATNDKANIKKPLCKCAWQAQLAHSVGQHSCQN
jgi:hypothetical protein